MTKQSELTPAERLEGFKQTIVKPVVLRGELAASAAASLVNGHPGVFVATGHSGYTVSHPVTGKPLERGERFEVDAQHFPRIVKALELGRVVPAFLWDDIQEYDQKRARWDELAPLGRTYADELKAVDQAAALLIAARAAVVAAEERLTLSREASLMAEQRLTEALDQAGL